MSYPLFQLNIQRAGLHLLSANLSLHLRGSVNILK
jgi:hypothetical protein